MDAEKPFKTIEVIDNATKQVCKIACMSCIRGHRTTSCGIPVCRTKIFWTVKRPGRPSNSCTCRFHSSGVCKCVTAIPKCPHKSRKGEKRTSECRCDEQGRFCCLLEPEHWDSLMNLEKPNVQFFSSREALEGWQTAQSPMTADTPATVYTMTPQRTGSCCGSSTTQSTPRTRSIAPSPADMASPKSSTILPRFGFLDVSSPMGANASPNVMSWNGETPVAPSDYSTTQSSQPEEAMQSSCCGSTSYDPPSMPWTEEATPVDSSQPEDTMQNSCCSYTPTASESFEHLQYQPSFAEYPAYTQATPAAFDFDRWNQNYHIYQFPNAICQNCGLNGCTCRSCPPLMQNFGTTSWAQSCGRRHARIAPMPAAQAPQQLSHQMSALHQHDTQGVQHTNLQDISHTHSPHMQSLPMHTMGESLASFNDHLMSPGASDPLAYSDFLMHELDRPSHVLDEHMFGG